MDKTGRHCCRPNILEHIPQFSQRLANTLDYSPTRNFCGSRSHSPLYLRV